MARRGASHSFNKRQKERKRKEKAERKSQRRLLRKQQAADPAGATTEDAASELDVDTVESDAETVEPSGLTEDPPHPNGSG